MYFVDACLLLNWLLGSGSGYHCRIAKRIYLQRKKCFGFFQMGFGWQQNCSLLWKVLNITCKCLEKLIQVWDILKWGSIVFINGDVCWHFWLPTTKFFSVVKSFNLTCSLHNSIQVDSLENLILICKSLGKAGLKLHQKTKRDPTAWILHFFDVDAWKNQESRLGWVKIGSQKCQKITKNAESYWKCQKSPKMPKLTENAKNHRKCKKSP